jgi:hypothetical protein
MAVSNKIKYPRREALRMLVAFEGQLKELKEFETDTSYTFGGLNNDRYAKFRAKAGEIYTLSIVVRTRIDNLDTGPDQELTDRFARATVSAQRTIIDASLRFMEALSKLENLPLGAREIFTGELRALYDARERLRDEKLQPFIDLSLEKKIEVAEAVLNTIIERAPKLLSLGGA